MIQSRNKAVQVAVVIKLARAGPRPRHLGGPSHGVSATKSHDAWSVSSSLQQFLAIIAIKSSRHITASLNIFVYDPYLGTFHY